MRPALVCLFLGVPFLATVVFIPLYWYFLTSEIEDVDGNNVWILFNTAVYLASRIEEAEKDFQLLKNLCLDLNLMGKKIDLFPFEGGGIGQMRTVRSAEAAVDLDFDWKTGSSTNVTNVLLWSQEAIPAKVKVILWIPGLFAYRNKTESDGDIHRGMQIIDKDMKLLIMDNHNMVEANTSNVEIVNEIKQILTKVGNTPDRWMITTAEVSNIEIDTTRDTSSWGSSWRTSTTGRWSTSQSTTATDKQLTENSAITPITSVQSTSVTSSRSSTSTKGQSTITTIIGKFTSSIKTSTEDRTSTQNIGSTPTRTEVPVEPSSVVSITSPVSTKSERWTEAVTTEASKVTKPTATDEPTTGDTEKTSINPRTERITTTEGDRTTGTTITGVITTGPLLTTMTEHSSTTAIWTETSGGLGTIPTETWTAAPTQELWTEVEEKSTQAPKEVTTGGSGTKVTTTKVTPPATFPTTENTHAWTEDKTTESSKTTGKQWKEISTSSKQASIRTTSIFWEITPGLSTDAETEESWTEVPTTAQTDFPEKATSTWTEAPTTGRLTSTASKTARPKEISQPWTEVKSTRTQEESTTGISWTEISTPKGEITTAEVGSTAEKAWTETITGSVTFGTSPNVEFITNAWTEVDPDKTTAFPGEKADFTTDKQWAEVSTPSSGMTTAGQEITQPPVTKVEQRTTATNKQWTEVSRSKLPTEAVTGEWTEDSTSAVTKEEKRTSRTEGRLPTTSKIRETIKPWTEIATTPLPGEKEATTGAKWTGITTVEGTPTDDGYTAPAWTKVEGDTTILPGEDGLTTEETPTSSSVTQQPFTAGTIEEIPTMGKGWTEEPTGIPIEISTEPFSESFTTGREIETTTRIEGETTQQWAEVKKETTKEPWTEAATKGEVWTEATDAWTSRKMMVTDAEEFTTAGQFWTKDATDSPKRGRMSTEAVTDGLTIAESNEEVTSGSTATSPWAEVTSASWTEEVTENRAQGSVTTAAWTESPSIEKAGIPPSDDPVVALLLS